MSIEGGSGGGSGGGSVGGIGGGIEGGPAGVPAVSGPSLCVPSFEAAPAGGLGSFGPKFEGPLTSIVSEGPVSFIDLKNTMPLQLGQTNPVSELRFNEPVKEVVNPEPLSVEPARVNYVPEPVKTEADAVQEAEYWLGVIKPAVELKPLEIVRPHIQTVIEEAEAVAQKAWEAHPITQAEQIVQRLDKQAPAILPVIFEKVEEVLVEEKIKQMKPKEVEEEEIETGKRAYLEDEEASAQRKYEIREATAKARAEADRLGLKGIVGWLVAKFLPAEHVGNRSRIVKKTGPDGSYQETVEAIAASGYFESERKAMEKFNEIVAEKKPVKIGKNGTPVGNGDVARVFKYHFFKPVQPHLEVVERIVKKKVQQPVQQVTVSVFPQDEKSKTESNITNFPILAGVFEKAA